jgi:hypothetical protein
MGYEDEPRAGPGRMASPAHSPDYADVGGDYGFARGTPVVETKPFFLTTEFAAVAVALAALGVTAAMSDSVGADLMWPLAVAIAIAYLFSRGFAKAGAASYSWDPRETGFARSGDGRGNVLPSRERASGAGQVEYEEGDREMTTVQREEYGTQTGRAAPYGYGQSMYGRPWGMRQPLPIETKPFFLTSEFWAAVAAIVGLAIAAGTSEQVDARLFWQLTTAITIGYVISRGIAKSGTKSRSWDPREDLFDRVRERTGREQQTTGT